MKWIFFGLVTINAMLYLWATNYPVGDSLEFSEEQLELNPRGMELVHERSIADADSLNECVRIGPFSTADTYSRASRFLINEGFGFTRKVFSEREERKFRVYLGPFLTQAARDTAENRLQQESIDYYEHGDKDGKLLSVAELFTEGVAAGAYVAELKKLGLDAEARSEARTLGPWRWLEVADVVNDERRDVLHQHEWGDAKAEILDVPCS
ncbi:MAG: hypothetical protein CL398_12820 [Acidiferrobacteraceae bacterium]|nr:hypothetical protein [Acidiferrobacteraceae bacterium]|tara:strand:+ start:733 stop:1362 length:630 start_codon:yes stop_codon:yes gene_type:complete